MVSRKEVKIHPSADVDENAKIGDETSIWHQAQIRENTKIGKSCIISKGVYIDTNVVIGDKCKIQNYVSVYNGVTIEEKVFVGPHAVFTNDFRPRAQPTGGWEITKTLVKKGASIGANATIRCGIILGEWCMIGSGSVVTKDVPNHALVYGNPGSIQGWVCYCGAKISNSKEKPQGQITCSKCGVSLEL